MERRTVLAVGLVLVVVAAGALAFAFGPSLLGGPAGPSPTGGGGGGNVTPTVADGGSGDEGTVTSGGTGSSGGSAPTVGQFTFEVLQIQECGQTCRDVTVRLTNVGNDSAHDVRVVTRIYTGGDQIWEGREDVGTLDANTSHTTTKRVQLGYWEAIKVKNNDGHITIQTTVRSAEGNHTFTQERDVA